MRPALVVVQYGGLYSVGSVVGPLASAALYAHIGWLATTQLISLFCAALAAALALVAFYGDRWFGGGATLHGHGDADGWRPCPDVAGALVRVEAVPCS